jgi:toxin ParE1/3/4
LRDIATFIARDNPSAALKLGDMMFARVDSLKKFPELGRIVPERNQPDIRELIVKNHRIIYRIHQKERRLEILRIWHGARGDPPM